MDRVTWKISVAGIRGSGKTSLISRIVYGSDGSGAPLKALFRKRLTLASNNSKVVADLLFQELNDESEAEKLLPGSNMILVVADILSPDGLEFASDVIRFAKNYEKKPPIVLVGTKTDLRYEAELWIEDFKKITKKLDVPYYMVSAKTGENAESLLDHITDILLERFYAKKQTP